MPRSIAILLACGLLLFGSLALASGAAAATIAPTTECSNGVPDTAGLGLICEVTVVNTITATGGSATVTVRECHGAANAAEAACTTTTDDLAEPVTAVTQCNNVLSGGGATLECSVDVTNNFVGSDPAATAATVNQCVGSSGGGGISIICDPVQSTTGATITQCNGSANGGGLVAGSTCTATGTQSSALGVTINQCNGSANGGGAFIVCSANIENNQVAGATPRPTAAPGSTPRVTPPSTDTVATSADAAGSGPLQIALMGIFLVALIALVASLRAAPKIRIR